MVVQSVDGCVNSLLLYAPPLPYLTMSGWSNMFNKQVVVNLNMPSKLSTGTGSKVMINLTDNKLQFKLNNYTTLICSSNENKLIIHHDLTFKNIKNN